MATVRELITKIGFSVDNKDLLRFESGLLNVKKSLTAVSLAGAGMVTSLFGIAKFTANAADGVKKLSDRTGLSTTALQELSFAAEQSNVSQEGLAVGLRLLNRQLFAARSGGKQAAASFGLLGANVQRAVTSGAPTEEVLAAIADRFRELPPGAKKSALAMKVFGRSGDELIPLFERGSEGMKEFAKRAHELGIVMDEEAIAAGKEFNDTFNEMISATKGLRNVIGGQLIKVLTPLIKQMTEFLVVNRELISENLLEFFKGFGIFLTGAFYAAKKLANGLKAVAAAFGGIGSLGKIAVTILGAFIAGQFLAGIGAVAIGLVKIANGFKLVGNQALIAQAKALALPLAVGAAFAAIFLLVEDIYGFFQGKDSILGRILAIVPEIGQIFSKIFGPIFDPIFKLIYGLTEGTLGWGDAFKTIGALLMNLVLAPLRAVFSTVEGAIALAARLTGNETLKSAAAFIGKGSDFLSVSPGNAPLPGGVGSADNRSTSISAPITVTVPPGTPPIEVGDRVFDGVSSGISNLLGGAKETFKPGLAY